MHSKSSSSVEDDLLPQAKPIDEHLLKVEDVAARYLVSIDLTNAIKSQGLLMEDSANRLKQYGLNQLTPPKKPSLLWIFMRQLLGLFNLLLIISGTLSFILFAIDTSSLVNIYLGAILMLVALMNATIDFVQQYKTATILESFKKLAPTKAMVVRESHLTTIDATMVVPGDVVFIQAGDRVPGDVRLFSNNDLRLDNSSITGEGEPLERDLAMASVINPFEATNLAFGGTNITNGEGFGIVIRTGDHTTIGQIARLAVGEKTPRSQLNDEIDLFVKRIAAVAVVVAAVFFTAGLLLGYSIGITFSFAIGIFVAFVPQGLPLTVSTLLTIAANRMAKRNVLVKNLHAVETLGAITLLATDKTGTLTQNKMEVTGLWLNLKALCCSELDSGGDSKLESGEVNLPSIVQACSLCVKSKFDSADENKPLQERTIIGDATEIGLLRFACRYRDVPEDQAKVGKLFEVPFSSATKWHMTVHRLPHANGELTVFIKGAPERIVAMCSSLLVGENATDWTEGIQREYESGYEHFASQGRRVLGFARYLVPALSSEEEETFVKKENLLALKGFEFLGLVALIDPPKRGVKKAIAACRTAGIQITMITGDHPLTAEAIGRQIGLVTGETIVDAAHRLNCPYTLVPDEAYDCVVVHGERLTGLPDSEWDRILSKREIIFARTSPAQKLEIVTKFQRKGHIVAVSGDGVNDSPALKKADLGISMNRTASDVSKEAAAMILLDDNFVSIIYGILEGRLIFANLKKSIRYTITHMFPEVLAFLIFIIVAIPLPISSLLVLLIDLGSELGPALSFAYESPESDLMLVNPRKVLCAPPTEIASKDLPDGKVNRMWRDLTDKIKTAFTKEQTGEVLVDSELMIWSIFQGGVIESIGCFAAYLTVLSLHHVPFDMLYGSAKTYWKAGAPDLLLTNGTIANASEQTAIAGSAQSAYYAAIVICQWFNLFVCKTKTDYPLGKRSFRNPYTYAGIVLSAIIACIVVYVPWINDVLLAGGPVPFLALLCPIGAGILLIGYEFARRFLVKKGVFGEPPKKNINLVELVRSTSTVR